MADVNLRRIEAKLDEVLTFVRQFRQAFAPRPQPSPEEVAKAEALSKELEEAMLKEMPSAEDLMSWSVPGPLPSEIAEAERKGAQS